MAEYSKEQVKLTTHDVESVAGKLQTFMADHIAWHAERLAR